MQLSSIIPFRNVLMFRQTITPGPRRVEPASKRSLMPNAQREATPVVATPEQDSEDPERWDGLA